MASIEEEPEAAEALAPSGSVRSRTAWYFAAAAGSTMLSFLALPLTTRILGPRDYGAFALVVAFMAFGTSLATLGAGFALNQRWPSAGSEERVRLVSALVWLALAAGGLWAALAIGSHAVATSHWEVAAQVPRQAVALTALGALATPLWLLAVELLTLQGRARIYAAGVVIEGVVRVGATLLALYGFRAGALSLFVGYAAGTAAQALLALTVLRPHLTLRIHRSEWRRQCALARHFLKAQLSDTGYVLLERTALSTGHGLHALGLYTHSQRYREMAQLAVKSVSRGIWPVTLSEANDAGSDFPRTKATWDPIFVLLGMAGVAAAFLGDELLRVLTNDKFTEAAPLITLWVVVVIVQNTAKAQFGVLYAMASGRQAAWLNVLANAAAALCLVPLLQLLGPAGALVAAGVQTVTFRLALRLVAARHRSVPFHDHWALAAAAAVLTAAAVSTSVETGVMGSLLLAMLGCGALAIASVRVLVRLPLLHRLSRVD